MLQFNKVKGRVYFFYKYWLLLNLFTCIELPYMEIPYTA